MPDHVRVVPEDMRVSAAMVDVHADTVRASHAAADGRIEAAQRGLPVASSVALTTAVTKWQADSSVLFGRMVDHSAGLHAGAADYERTDDDGARGIEVAGAAISPDDMGL